MPLRYPAARSLGQGVSAGLPFQLRQLPYPNPTNPDRTVDINGTPTNYIGEQVLVLDQGPSR